MSEERMGELKFAVNTVFEFWLQTAFPQKGMSEESNERAKEYYIKDRDDVISLIDAALAESNKSSRWITCRFCRKISKVNIRK